MLTSVVIAVIFFILNIIQYFVYALILRPIAIVHYIVIRSRVSRVSTATPSTMLNAQISTSVIRNTCSWRLAIRIRNYLCNDNISTILYLSNILLFGNILFGWIYLLLVSNSAISLSALIFSCGVILASTTSHSRLNVICTSND